MNQIDFDATRVMNPTIAGCAIGEKAKAGGHDSYSKSENDGRECLDEIPDLVAKAEAVKDNKDCRDLHKQLVRAINASIKWTSESLVKYAKTIAAKLDKWLPEGWWDSFTKRLDEVWRWFKSVCRTGWRFLVKAWNKLCVAFEIGLMHAQEQGLFPIVIAIQFEGDRRGCRSDPRPAR